MDLDLIFENAVRYLNFNEKADVNWKESDIIGMKGTLSLLQENNLLEYYELLLYDNFREDLKERIVPIFRKQVLFGGVTRLTEAVKSLHQNIAWYTKLIELWPDNYRCAAKIREIFISCLLWDLDSKMKNVFAEFYSHAFQVDTWISGQDSSLSDISMEEENSSEGESVDHIVLEWNGKTRKMLKKDCADYIQNEFTPLASTYLFDLDLLFLLAEQPVSQVLEIEIKRYVEKTCKGKYEKSWIHSHLKTWIETQVMTWLEKIFGRKWKEASEAEWFEIGGRSKTASYSKNHWNQKLLFILYETYTEMRISEMFRIITEFPESSPAIEDLKLCLERTNQRPFLIKTLKKDLSNRVLHPGVCTEDIITMYISAVKALRLLDPSGVVMEIVLEGYTKYLKERDDTVKKIMAALLDEDRDNDLAIELARGTSEADTVTPISATASADSNFVEVTKRYKKWVPDPREADPDKADKSRRTSDIISLLVGMYGSTTCFIEEYQELLSRRLLSNWCSNTSEDAEIKNLELLKLRFGEEDMGKCAVMLKDVADSRRINTYVKDEYSKKSEVPVENKLDVSTLIVSSEYWPAPAFQSHDINLPSAIQSALDNFNKGYESHKASRSLKWIHSAGRVDIELELKDRTLQFQVTVLLASIISLFHDKETWTVEEISNEVKVSATVLKRKIVYWLQQGILKETAPDTYSIIEEQPVGSMPQNSAATKNDLANLLEEDEEEEDTKADDLKQKQQEQVLWNYVQGMLMNFESLPLDRIHKMLKMFAMQDSSMKLDQPKLRIFLNSRVQSGLLSIEGGKYRINKDS
uniref:anaphase-promoting complex subunit 2-like n=1 Tax=Styela clava TaxID=7725 RepID=UPI0019397ED4|nr:anaphase-promoting complex subunit 2-like [Styela clava]